jgi:hypothetical protein
MVPAAIAITITSIKPFAKDVGAVFLIFALLLEGTYVKTPRVLSINPDIAFLKQLK